MQNSIKECSKYFYMKVSSDYALWTDPASKGGGERISYPVPTAQALKGIVDACYFKPTIVNVVDSVKVVNPIMYKSFGYRALYRDMSADLNHVTALSHIEYLIKFHFEWNYNRPDLMHDRNIKKHESIMERSLKKGGRRDIFLGVREFIGDVEYIDEYQYTTCKTAYDGSSIDFGYMFHHFDYPNNNQKKFKSIFAKVKMESGIIKFDLDGVKYIENELSSYTFRQNKTIVSVDEELKNYRKGD